MLLHEIKRQLHLTARLARSPSDCPIQQIRSRRPPNDPSVMCCDAEEPRFSLLRRKISPVILPDSAGAKFHQIGVTTLDSDQHGRLRRAKQTSNFAQYDLRRALEAKFCAWNRDKRADERGLAKEALLVVAYVTN